MIQLTQDSLKSIQLKAVTAEDSLDIWKWRNDSLSRKMSISQKKITWYAHNRWLKKQLSKDLFWMATIKLDHDQYSIGVVRVSEEDKSSHGLYGVISINLNPIFRGKKLSYLILNQVIRDLEKKYKALELIAYIKKENRVSQKLFFSLGFKPLDRRAKKKNSFPLVFSYSNLSS